MRYYVVSCISAIFKVVMMQHTVAQYIKANGPQDGKIDNSMDNINFE